MSRPPFPDTARPRVPFVAGPFVAGGFTGHARRGARRRPRRFCLPCLPPPTQLRGTPACTSFSVGENKTATAAVRTDSQQTAGHTSMWL